MSGAALRAPELALHNLRSYQSEESNSILTEPSLLRLANQFSLNIRQFGGRLGGLGIIENLSGVFQHSLSRRSSSRGRTLRSSGALSRRRKIESALEQSETLVHINSKDPVILKTDASVIGIAGILLQQQNNQWPLVTCLSRSLTPAERNYSPIESEGLAIIHALSKLRHFLLGRKFKIRMRASHVEPLPQRSTPMRLFT